MTGRLLRYARERGEDLSRNTRHRFAADHALMAFQTGAIYSFIPKNACSSLRVSLALANGCIAGTEDWTWIHRNNATFRAGLRDLVTAPFSFVILRCPHARLASAFLDKMVGRRSEFWRLQEADSYGIDPDSFTFRQFVTCLERRKMLALNHHWCPQEEFLVYEDYDLWVALENFRDAIPDIAAGTGMEIVDARPLTGHGTDGLEVLDDTCFADTPMPVLAEMRRKGRVPSHAALYDAELADRAAALYRGDGRLYRGHFGAGGLLFPETFATTDTTT